MQTRSEHPDHHQSRILDKKSIDSPEAELIALALTKGQVLTERTFRVIHEALELRGITLPEFVADVRPHFRNNILNPSGFLINRARNFHQLSRAATAPARSTPVRSAAVPGCETCRGQKYVIAAGNLMPCPGCSTPEFRREWEMKEAEREWKMRAIQDAKR